MSEFQPCPICGYKYIGVDMKEGIEHDEYYIFCRNCQYKTHVHFTERGAKKEWESFQRPVRWKKGIPPEQGWYILDSGYKNWLIGYLLEDRFTLLNGITIKVNDSGKFFGPIPEFWEEAE